MSASFILIAPAVPHRMKEEGKFEILINVQLATTIALDRLKSQTTESLANYDFMEYREEELHDDNGDVVRERVEAVIADIISEFYSNFNSDEGAIISLDKPRLFTGGMTWGDEPSEIYGNLESISSMGLFEKAITFEESGETEKADWVPSSWY